MEEKLKAANSIDDIDKNKSKVMSKKSDEKNKKKLADTRKQNKQEIASTVDKENTDDCIELLKRARADFINYKKRINKQIEDSVFYELKKHILEFLLFKQSLKDALMHEKNKDSIDNLKLLNKKFDDILNRLNVKKLDVLYKKFDYNTSECVDRRKVNDVSKNNKVIEVLQDGYIFNNKIILPAKVVVGVMEE